MRALWLALVPLQLLLILTKFTVAQATTQSIASDTAWQALDPCARACFQTWVAGCWAPALDGILGCDSNYCLYASNDCYCRADHQPVAVSYLSSCVSKSCTVGNAQIDVNSAVTVYDGYCSSNGFLATAPATTPASTTQGPIATTTVPSASSSSTQSSTSSNGASSVVHVPTSSFTTSFTTSQSDSATTVTEGSSGTSTAGSSGGGYDTSDRIALGVGIGVGLPATIASILTLWYMCIRGG